MSMTRLSRAVRIARAVLTNQLARYAPSVYVRLTGQTGRGAAVEEGAADIAQYFRECIDAYAEHLGLTPGELPEFLSGKVVMEYGPGDLPGVAALLVGRGAKKVYCVDRFPLVNMSEKNAQVIADLISGENEAARGRLRECLSAPSQSKVWFDPQRLEYLVKPNGLSGLVQEVDLVISRAVLEHVNDLDGRCPGVC